MSDEAFARRFYSDRGRADRPRRPASLAARRVHGRGALHAPLRELLPRQARARRRRAGGAPDGAPHARRHVRVRRAAPARAAEPRARATRASTTPRPRRRRASRCAIPTTRRRWRAGSRSSSPRSRSSARSSSATGRRVATRCAERSLNPYALRRDRGTWYVVGEDLDHDDVRTFRVSRIRSDIRFATRRERDFRVPPDFDVDAYRVGEDWQHGPVAGTARDRGERGHRLVGAPHAERGRDADRRGLRDGVRGDRAARRLGAAPERPRDPARARGPSARMRRGAQARPGSARGRGAEAGAREVAGDRRGRRRTAGAAGGPGALRRPPGSARVPARRLR